MGGQDAALDKQVNMNLNMADSMYQTAIGAQKGLMDYTTGAYKMGGFDQSAKFTALQSGILDALNRKGPGNFLNPQELGGMAAMRAEAVSNVGAEKLKAGMDEMNKIRSTLAGNGLATTNFAQSEGQIGVQSAAQMDYNPTMSTISAVGGLAATAYGAYKNKPQKTSNFGTAGSSNWVNPATGVQPGGFNV